MPSSMHDVARRIARNLVDALERLAQTGHRPDPDALSASAVYDPCPRRPALDALRDLLPDPPEEPGPADPYLRHITAGHAALQRVAAEAFGLRALERRFGPHTLTTPDGSSVRLACAVDGIAAVDDTPVLVEIKTTERHDLTLDPPPEYFAQALLAAAVVNAQTRRLPDPVPVAQALQAGPLRGALLIVFDRYDVFRFTVHARPTGDPESARAAEDALRTLAPIDAARQNARAALVRGDDPRPLLPPALPPGHDACRTCAFRSFCHTPAPPLILGGAPTSVPDDILRELAAYRGRAEAIRRLEALQDEARRRIYAFMQEAGTARLQLDGTTAYIQRSTTYTLRPDTPPDVLRELLGRGLIGQLRGAPPEEARSYTEEQTRSALIIRTR